MTTERDMVPGTNIPKPTCKLIGRDGNAFAVMGAVSGALRKAGVPKEARDKFVEEATSGDYDHLLRVAMNYVLVR